MSSEPSSPATASTKRKSAASIAIEGIDKSGIDLFHDEQGAPWAWVNDTYRKPLRIDSEAFKDYVLRFFFKSHHSPLGAKSLRDVLDLYSAMARESQQEPVFVRRGEVKDDIYVDLCNDKWEVVRISASGWTIEPSSPIAFFRPPGALALPSPKQPAGSYHELLSNFVKLASEEDFILVQGFILGAYSAGPYPVLSIQGQQGDGKTTLTRVIRKLVDPNVAETRAAPREERDLLISANNSWLMAYDNLTKVSDWQSEAFCRLATGAAMGIRKLYTNDEECIFTAKRPLIINGITDIISKDDLMDRTILVKTGALNNQTRKPENVFWRDFEVQYPFILGAIFDLVSKAIAAKTQKKAIEMPEKPRMYDFAYFVESAFQGTGRPAGSFLAPLDANRRESSQNIVENSVVGAALVDFLGSSQVRRNYPNGIDETANSLFTKLQDFANAGRMAYARELERTRVNEFGKELIRLIPALQKMGIVVAGIRKNTGMVYSIRKRL